MTLQILSKIDVERLLNEPSPELRLETAEKIAQGYAMAKLSPSERAIAEEIFRLMVRDAEVRVRQVLSENLKKHPGIPHDVAFALANDVTDVATPILQVSSVLTDVDLMEIIGAGDQTKQLAIAGRPQISEGISDALVATANEEIVTTLVANEGAALSEPSLQMVIDLHGTSQAVQERLVYRPHLPLTVSERLVTMVSEHLRDELAKRQELPADLATDLILQSRERVVMGLAKTQSNDEELDRLVQQLNENGRLTYSLMLRALCMGDLDFYEAAMSELAGVPIKNARALIYDGGLLGLRGIYDKAGLPDSHYPAARAAIDVASEMEYDGLDNDRARYSRRMIERVLTQYGDLGVNFEGEDLDYLLRKMDMLPSTASTDGPA